jgi:uncharacterized membrane protein YgcG
MDHCLTHDYFQYDCQSCRRSRANSAQSRRSADDDAPVFSTSLLDNLTDTSPSYTPDPTPDSFSGGGGDFSGGGSSSDY